MKVCYNNISTELQIKKQNKTNKTINIMKNLKLLLFSLLLISTLAQCQTTPPLKLRSADSFTQVDHFLNVKKRFGIPFSSINNLFCNGSYPLMFNTTEGKLKLYNGDSWINPFSLNLQEVTTFGNTTTNPINVLNNNITVSENNNVFNTISLRPDGLWFIPDGSEYITKLVQGNASQSLVTIQLPDDSGTLITDAPYDGNSYVRKNNGWQLNSSGGTPTLQQVLSVDNSATDTGISLIDSSNNSNSFSVSNTGFSLSKDISGTITNTTLNGFTGFSTQKGSNRVSVDVMGIKLTNNFPIYDNRLLASNVTGNRIWTLPDASGTLALTTTDTRPYKTIVAILSQTGTNAPTIQYLMENTLGSITFAYNFPGQYKINSSALFTSGKTTVTISSVNAGFGNPNNGVQVNSNSEMTLKSAEGATQVNGPLNGAVLEIRVYN